MLRIYYVMLDVIRSMRPAVAAIEMHDRDLARQIRRAASSVVLNVAEGSGGAGGTRRQRYRDALGSARETRGCLDSALAWGYADGIEPAVEAGLREVIGTLVNVLR